MVEHRLRSKRVILAAMRSGQKQIEVRVSDRRMQNVRVGDVLVFDFDGEVHRRRVSAIRQYHSFESLLAGEVTAKVMPGWNKSEILRGLRTIYPEERESLGVLGFELETMP